GRGHSVEEPRVRQRLGHADVRTAKFRNVASNAEPEVVIEISEAAARNRLGVDLPCKTDSGGNLIRFVKPRVIVPTQAEVQRELRKSLPVVLQKQSVII